MKNLKKYLIPFLLCSIFCFIPKTYAISVTSDHIYADIYTSTEPFTKTTQFYDVASFTAPTDTFPVFKALIYDTEDITLSCSTPSYDICYRVDHQLFGAHNEFISNWVPFAKSLIAESSTLNTMGSIIAIESWDKMNISTFFKRKIESDCVSTTLNSFVIDIYDVPQNKHFYNPNHFGSYYNTYNKSVNEISCTYAQNLIDEYYETGSFDNEKLEEIQSSIDEVNGKLEQTNEKLDDINDNLTDSNINGAQNTANGFFNSFTDNDYGLSSIITIPLTSVQKITNSSCSPLRLPIPFVNKTIDLPCMYEIYNNFPVLLNIWQIVSFGLISYSIIVDIFGLVKKFKDPNDDKLEVMDL